VVVSIKGKGIEKGVRCVLKKANNCELSTEASKGLDDVKTKVQYQFWEEQRSYLFTVAAASGV